MKKEKTYKSALGVRGDSTYCPLSFSLDSYFNCLVDCHHCSFRSLNHVWGMDLRPADPEAIRNKLEKGLKNKFPISSLANCISQKKTIRFGSRSDPFQPIENELGVSGKILGALNDLDWSFAVQTRFPSNLLKHRSLLFSKKSLFTFIPVMSPGLDKDWEVLERGITDPPETRLKISEQFIKRGINTGFNGEPFIPGYHTIKDFKDTMLLLKQYHIPSYNTYNFHFNPYVAKRLYAIGVDIEKIWFYNQDTQWKKILPKLIMVASNNNVRLGCPDFVNSGWKDIQTTNTCCGVQVPNPTTYNTHIWKQEIQKGEFTVSEMLQETWDGIGDYDKGKQIVSTKKSKDFYTLNDIVN